MKVMSMKGRGQETALTQGGIGLGKGSWTRHPGEARRWGWVSRGVSCRSLGNGEGSEVIGWEGNENRGDHTNSS